MTFYEYYIIIKSGLLKLIHWVCAVRENDARSIEGNVTNLKSIGFNGHKSCAEKVVFLQTIISMTQTKVRHCFTE